MAAEFRITGCFRASLVILLLFAARLGAADSPEATARARLLLRRRNVSAVEQTRLGQAIGEEKGADTKAAEEEAEGEGESAIEGLSVDSLCILVKTLLPAEIATVIMGALMLLRSVHDNISRSFKSFPGQSCAALVTLLGIFCWTTLSMLWVVETREHEKLGKWTIMSGLFATSVLFVTPIFLLVPQQGDRTENLARELFGHAAVEVGKKTFKDWSRSMAQVYLVLALFQILAAWSIFRIADQQEQEMQKVAQKLRSATQAAPSMIQEFLPQLDEDSEGLSSHAGPYTMTILYLILAWCNLTVVYERLLGRSFSADFPTEILKLACPFCVGEGQALTDLVRKELFDHFDVKGGLNACLQNANMLSLRIESALRDLHDVQTYCEYFDDNDQMQEWANVLSHLCVNTLVRMLYQNSETSTSIADAWDGAVAEACLGIDAILHAQFVKPLWELLTSNLQGSASENSKWDEKIKEHVDSFSKAVERVMELLLPICLDSKMIFLTLAPVIPEESWSACVADVGRLSPTLRRVTLKGPIQERGFIIEDLEHIPAEGASQSLVWPGIFHSIEIAVRPEVRKLFLKFVESARPILKESQDACEPLLKGMTKIHEVLTGSVKDVQTMVAAPEVLRTMFMEQTVRVLSTVDPLLTGLPEPVLCAHYWIYLLAGIAGVVTLSNLLVTTVRVIGSCGAVWIFGTAMIAMLFFCAVFLFWAAMGQLHKKLPTMPALKPGPAQATPGAQAAAPQVAYAMPPQAAAPQVAYAMPPQIADRKVEHAMPPQAAAPQVAYAMPPQVAAAETALTTGHNVVGADYMLVSTDPEAPLHAKAFTEDGCKGFYQLLKALLAVSWAILVWMVCEHSK